MEHSRLQGSLDTWLSQRARRILLPTVGRKHGGPLMQNQWHVVLRSPEGLTLLIDASSGAMNLQRQKRR